MSLPRFFCSFGTEPREGAEIPLEPAQVRHLGVLRVRAGDAVELVLPSGPWTGDLTAIARDRATVRLVAPLAQTRETPHPLEAHLPVPAQASLLDEMLAPLVELGVTRIRPVLYARGTQDVRKVTARLERWERIVVTACEQSHRTRIPRIDPPAPFAALLEVDLPQKWVAYELRTGERNPVWRPGPLAFTSGPEGGITEEEFRMLSASGWSPVSLGPAILRAVTAPVALAGAVQFLQG
jgi:16S rRNA (uracil1498-N3)-methyltransferase